MAFPKSRILTTKRFIQFFKESAANKQRFCFILGSGTSAESGIPTASQLATHWMNELMGVAPNDTKSIAERLYEDREITHRFDEIEKAWKEAHNSYGCLSSEYFFDLFKLYFHPNPLNGYRYLELLLENRKPSLGYRVLSQLLTNSNQHNLVITTNYDTLVEDALLFYTNKRPLVINQNSLVDFINIDTQRPIIAKVYRELLHTPSNGIDITNNLKDKWREVLNNVFTTYTPIVIGYSGGGVLMEALLEATFRNGVFWCYRKVSGLPGQRIQDFIGNNSGYLVEIDSFDALMMGLNSNLDTRANRRQEDYMNTQTINATNRNTVFISYSWDSDEHKRWVRSLYDRLLTQGFNMILDQVDLIPGDSLTHFMEQSISGSDYVLIICTPKYKEKADARKGGVGYEESIITSEVITKRNDRKFIPVLATGNWVSSTPIWAAAKYGIDLSDSSTFDDEFNKLVNALNRKNDQKR